MVVSEIICRLILTALCIYAPFLGSGIWCPIVSSSQQLLNRRPIDHDAVQDAPNHPSGISRLAQLRTSKGASAASAAKLQIPGPAASEGPGECSNVFWTVSRYNWGLSSPSRCPRMDPAPQTAHPELAGVDASRWPAARCCNSSHYASRACNIALQQKP